MTDSDPFALTEYLFEQFNNRKLAFLEVNEAATFGLNNDELIPKIYANQEKKTIRELFKRKFNGTFITNKSMTFESGNIAIEEGHTDMVSFGNLYCCNDDLVERWTEGREIRLPANADPKLFSQYYYGSGAAGYTDLSVYDKKEKEGSPRL